MKLISIFSTFLYYDMFWHPNLLTGEQCGSLNIMILKFFRNKSLFYEKVSQPWIRTKHRKDLYLDEKRGKIWNCLFVKWDSFLYFVKSFLLAHRSLDSLHAILILIVIEE